MKRVFVRASALLYGALRPLIFKTDCERAHKSAENLSAFVGRNSAARASVSCLFKVRRPSLTTNAGGVTVDVPVGLAAGYDYEGRAARAMSALSFGFTTVGTMTYGAYEGNPAPRLGRLIRSRSLMVNKGFRSPGAQAVLATLGDMPFDIPTGVSIGQTNKEYHETDQAIEDIAAGFRKARDSSVPFAYYELNISCPNLRTAFNFYDPRHFAQLLRRVTETPLKRPLWVKMPINCTNEETVALLDVCAAHHVDAVVIGNLQHRRDVTGVIREESDRFPMGNLSGKPTEARSNELIKLAYRSYRDRLAIVGCGGIFSAADAYRKVRLGASMTELITGLIWQGPQLVADVALGLDTLLVRDGFSRLADAVGADA